MNSTETVKSKNSGRKVALYAAFNSLRHGSAVTDEMNISYSDWGRESFALNRTNINIVMHKNKKNK